MTAAPIPATRPAKVRDPRLDFFRGIALFVILVSHTRGNWLSDWIPARFGLSDAAAMFVFVSGYAGGLAFGGVYKRAGWLLGSARIGLRVWQLYIAQLAIVLVVAALAVAANRLLPGQDDYRSVLQLDHLFADPADALLGIVTLTYVPHYLDILPVYMVVLAMVPVAVALARLVHPLAVLAASAALWALANAYDWNLPSPSDPRGWFFNPFCWQLLFFTGFSLSMKWLTPPPADRRIFRAAVAYILFGVAVTVPAIYETVPGLDLVQAWILGHADKTFLDPLQILHFFATAYVAVYLLTGRLHLIQGQTVRPLVKCGQQALSIFLAGILLADLAGMAFDLLGTGFVAQVLVNGVCFAVLFAVAYGVAWIKSAPWAKPATTPAPAPAAANQPAEPVRAPTSARPRTGIAPSISTR
ncbi:membrane protein [Aliidongia dinghuensis]|uniref:Membrane protein n=1 Tax=Aliidongia dinghuensis TaxID=1867774 RepID=A0A8J2YU99_9PROT|nr:OpgC domain-containing protein [Aliidongia dinghuensis]GGF18790.1 membrane protein [Aliidongia dinghuensis]